MPLCRPKGHYSDNERIMSVEHFPDSVDRHTFFMSDFWARVNKDLDDLDKELDMHKKDKEESKEAAAGSTSGDNPPPMKFRPGMPSAPTTPPVDPAPSEFPDEFPDLSQVTISFDALQELTSRALLARQTWTNAQKEMGRLVEERRKVEEEVEELRKHLQETRNELETLTARSEALKRNFTRIQQKQMNLAAFVRKAADADASASTDPAGSSWFQRYYQSALRWDPDRWDPTKPETGTRFY